MYFRKHTKFQDLVETRKLDENEKLETEEGRKKAQSLFSKKFMEYLSNKKSNPEVLEIGKSLISSSLQQQKKQTKATTSSDETSVSESPRKCHKKFRKKGNDVSLFQTFDYAFRSKPVQCSLLKEEEIVMSDELKPFLMNMSILLQELKQTWSDLPEAEMIFNLLSKITILITEFGRRPIMEIEEVKKDENFINLEKTMAEILNLVNEFKKNSTFEIDNDLKEYKTLQREFSAKKQQLEEIKKILEEEEDVKPNLKESDINLRVRSHILYNERLKAQIKFNQSKIKKYKKALMEKEYTKHKLESEMAQIKRKMSKCELTSDGESHDKSTPSSNYSLKSQTSRKVSNFNIKSPKPKEKLKNSKIPAKQK